MQNYDPVFYVETAFRGLHVTTPKFELPIAQEGMVYKIVQSKYKIMIYFSFSKSVLVGPVTCTSSILLLNSPSKFSSPPTWFAYFNPPRFSHTPRRFSLSSYRNDAQKIPGDYGVVAVTTLAAINLERLVKSPTLKRNVRREGI